MNRIVAIAPIALLATACAVRTPATALEAHSDLYPPMREVVLPSDGEAIAAWQLPMTSPWSPYEKLTLLTYLADRPVEATMPHVAGLEVVQRARTAAARLAAVGVPQGTMWVVDLRGAASVAFGATLSQRSGQPIAPVMTFNNWPADHEEVPAEQTHAANATKRPRPLETEAGVREPIPVFLLDEWRLALRDRQPDDEEMDNRYVLLSSDFPDPAVLRARGIQRVIYVVEDRDRSGIEEDDFHEVARAYQDAGLAISLVDLEELGALEDAPADTSDERWAACYQAWSFTIAPRATLFDSPRFYALARGGFGGAHAAPSRSYTPASPHANGVPNGSGRAYSGASPHVAGGSGG